MGHPFAGPSGQLLPTHCSGVSHPTGGSPWDLGARVRVAEGRCSASPALLTSVWGCWTDGDTATEAKTQVHASSSGPQRSPQGLLAVLSSPGVYTCFAASLDLWSVRLLAESPGKRPQSAGNSTQPRASPAPPDTGSSPGCATGATRKLLSET